jgi:multidrug efflux system outer membrane protein
MRLAFRSIAITAAMCAAGCASAPTREAPRVDVEVPAHWSLADSLAVRGTAGVRWWTDFGDSTLDALVEEALAENYDLKAAAARVDAAEATARLAGAEGLPSASLGLSASRRRQNLIGIPIPGAGEVISTRSTSYGVSLDTSWEPDLWGRVRSAKSASLADLQASGADLAALRLSVAAQTAKAWFALVESGLQMELAAQTVESYRLSADKVRERYERGVTSSLDLRLAMSNLHSAEAMLEARRQGHDLAKRGLEILLGRYPSASLAESHELAGVSGAVPAGLPSALLIRRPDLFAAERRYAAAEKRVSEARRAFFPRLSLTGSGGTLSRDLADLVDGDFGVWSIAAGLTQPIFQGGRLRANLALSEALADQALAAYAQALLTGFSEVESALYADGSLAAREAALKLAAEQSDAARSLAESQYEAGIVDYITVLETQRRALTSRSELIAVARQRLDARVNLHLALGGGFNLEGDWMRFLETPGDPKPGGEAASAGEGGGGRAGALKGDGAESEESVD